jgi:hypothetical protein
MPFSTTNRAFCGNRASRKFFSVERINLAVAPRVADAASHGDEGQKQDFGAANARIRCLNDHLKGEGRYRMLRDDDVPKTHPFPAYFDLTDHDDVMALCQRAYEQKYNAMLTHGTIPRLQSELDDIIGNHCSAVVFSKEIAWLRQNGYMRHVDVATWEDYSITRLAFDSDQRRTKFIARFPRWSTEPQGFIFTAGIQTGENKLDVLLTVEDSAENLRAHMVLGSGMGEPLPKPTVKRQVFEIATPPEEVRKYLEKKASEADE